MHTGLQANIERDGSPVETLKLYLVGSHSTRLWLNKEVLSDVRMEVVGEADCSERAREEIVHAQPHVVIHATDLYDEKELSLLHGIKGKLPATYYIVLGNVLNFAFRVRYSSSGADLVLNLMSESYKVRELLRRMVYNFYKNRLVRNAQQRVDSDLASSSDLGKIFSLMDKSPDGLMFADQDHVLRHLNPAALASFSPLEQFLPDKVYRLVGLHIGTFHRERSIVNKIVGDPKNLPYNTQVVIGPKTFDLMVRAVYDEQNKFCSGVIARWKEIPEI